MLICTPKLITDSEADDEPSLDDISDGFDIVARALLKSVAKCPDMAREARTSLERLAGMNGKRVVAISLKFLESHFTLTVEERMRVYCVLVDPVLRSLPGALDIDSIALTPAQVKSFVLRIVADIDAISLTISGETLNRMSELIAHFSVCAFEEIVVELFLQALYIGRRLTVEISTVQSSLLMVFGDLVPGPILSAHLEPSLVRLASMATAGWINLELVSAVAKGVHRTGMSVLGNAVVFSTAKTLLSAIELSETSAETVVAILSLIDPLFWADPPFDSLVPQIEEYIFFLGESQREEAFLATVSSMWTYKVSGLFQLAGVPRLELLFELVLSSDHSPGIWRESPECTVSFLCRTVHSGSALRFKALEAVTEIAQGPRVSHEIIEMIERVLSEDDSLDPTFVEKIVRLIATLDGVTPPMIEFLLKNVTSENSEKNKTVAADALLSICQSSSSDKRYLLFTLLERLSRTPSGVVPLCRCVSVLMAEAGDCVDALPLDQGVHILVWLFYSIWKLGPADVQPCLGLVLHILHPAWETAWADSRTSEFFPEKNVTSFAVGPAFAFLVSFIDEDADRAVFAAACADTCIAEMGRSAELATVLVPMWAICVRELADRERVTELLGMKKIVADAGEGLAREMGRFATDWCEFCLDSLNTLLQETEASLDASTSLLNAVRMRRNEQSLIGGLFTSEKYEAETRLNLAVKSVCIRALAECLRDVPGEEIGSEILKKCIREIVTDTRVLRENPFCATDVFPETTIAAVEGIGICAAGNNPLVIAQFHAVAIDACLQLLVAASQTGAVPLVRPLLHTLTALVQLDHLPLSEDTFGALLETCLHAVVQSLPDSVASLEARVGILSARCDEASLLVRALCLHAASWRGLSSIARAVHSIGANGPLPLVRWMSVRILASLVETAADTVRSDSDLEQFLDVVGALIPRLKDSFEPAAVEARIACMHLLQRWEPTKDTPSGAVNVPALVLANLNDKHIPSFLLVLISHVHESDSAAAEYLLDVVVDVLASRSASALAPEEAPADALVEAILGNAKKFPSPPAPPPHWEQIQLRLVDALKYIAAVRFPIAVQQVLQPPMREKAQAVYAFCRDKTTLVLLVRELMTRMAVGKDAVAVQAMGLVLDCGDEAGVTNIAQKYFGEIFAALMVHGTEGVDVQSVSDKLWRVAGYGDVPGPTDVDSLYCVLGTEVREKIISSMADFLRKIFFRAVVVASQLVGRSAAVDALFLELFMALCRAPCDDHTKLRHAIIGLRNIVQRWTREVRDSIEDTADHVKSLLVILSAFITHMDHLVALEALITLGRVLELVNDSEELTPILVTRILPQMRRVIDHKHESVRTAAFNLLTATCDKLHPEAVAAELIQPFYKSVGDLWIPCLVRTQDPDAGTRKAALKALVAIVNSGFAETRVEHTDFDEDPLNQFSLIMDLAKSEIGECSHVHINACSYYLIGLSATPNEVVLAAIKLLPIVISMIPDPSAEAIDSINDVIEKIFNFNNKAFTHFLADIIIEGNRVDPNRRAIVRSS